MRHDLSASLADACEGEETGEFLRKKYKKETRLSYKKVTENNGISGNLNALAIPIPL